MRLLLYTGILVLGLLGACKEKVMSDRFLSFRYAQTGCSDPWPAGGNDSATGTLVRAYLDSLGLAPVSIEIRADGVAELCNACSCKTGKRIYVSTLYQESLIRRYADIGFERLPD
ncbi:MAG: hypothetical protein EOO11_01300 [Chitinophagaceae bacterium]|nr:MAG: hypothetical protein EOO11_01300 [Chitinophagaceae bacterium]